MKKRICTACKTPIKQTHRWRQTHHRFLFWTWRSYAHHNCQHPDMGPAKPLLKGEVPLPFPDSPLKIEYQKIETGVSFDAKPMDSVLIEHVPASSTGDFWTAPETPRTEIARLD